MFCTCFVSSAEIENKNIYNINSQCYFNNPKIEILSNKTAYAFNTYPGPNGIVKFQLNDPGNLTMISEVEQPFFTGGTWTNDWECYACSYSSGSLYGLNLCSGETWCIGGGGTSLNGLSYNPITEKLYGASRDDLFEINITTGEQTYIGGFGNDQIIMIGIAFDENGTLFGWDTYKDKLWTIDIENGNATEVGPLGIDIRYAQDGHFDLDTDALYLSAYTTTGGLYKCNKRTGKCTLIGEFEDGAELTALTIPYGDDIYPPKTRISQNPYQPNGKNGWYDTNVSVRLYTCDISGINSTFYRVNEGDWNVYTSPVNLTKDGKEILFEFYSVDKVGNKEDVKSKIFNIDKTPPNTTLKSSFIIKGMNIYIKFILNAKDETSGMDSWVDFYFSPMKINHFDNVSWPIFEYLLKKFKGCRDYYYQFICSDIAGHKVIEAIHGSDIKINTTSNLKLNKIILS